MTQLEAVRGFLQYLHREVVALPDGVSLWQRYFEHACADEEQSHQPAITLKTKQPQMLEAGLLSPLLREPLQMAMQESFGHELGIIVRAEASESDAEETECAA